MNKISIEEALGRLGEEIKTNGEFKNNMKGTIVDFFVDELERNEGTVSLHEVADVASGNFVDSLTH